MTSFTWTRIRGNEWLATRPGELDLVLIEINDHLRKSYDVIKLKPTRPMKIYGTRADIEIGRRILDRDIGGER